MRTPFPEVGRPSRQRFAWIFLLGLTLSACGGGGPGEEPPAVNQPPVAVATISPTAPHSSLVITLNGASSTDPDGTVSSYSWTQTSGPTVSLSANNAAQVTFVAPPVASPTNLVFRLTVTDDDEASAVSNVTTTVSPAPIVMSLARSSDKPFSVDDELVSFQLSDAKLGGAAVHSTSIVWSSNVSGTLPGGSTTLDVVLPAGLHAISVRADFGDLGVITRSIPHPVLPRTSQVPASLATAAAGTIVVVPIVLINHIPTEDGLNVDSLVTGPSGTSEWTGGSINSLQSWILTITTRAKFMLEEGSRFRGYKTPESLPYVGYKVIAIYNFYEAMPPGFPDPAISGNTFPDYHAILARIPAQELVEGPSAVREIWLNSYHFGKMSLNESNMASPLTPDISNSYRTPGDLPVFSKTYVLYQTNYTRSQAEAVHNHGHQIEAMLSYINQRYDGNTNLFWRSFVGLNATGAFEPGRCGATHFPLNARGDYDYLNSINSVQSDCEDWKPDGSGTRKTASLSTWDGVPYAWPNTGAISQKTESQWYIYWMQNLPGDGNTIPYSGTTMENWWRLIVEWDDSILAGRRLYK